MRKLTVKHRPAMLALIEHWKKCFGELNVELDPTQLVDWMERYDDEVIRKGFQVTSDWHRRKMGAADFVQVVDLYNTDVYKYASSVMRNVARSHATAKRILGGSLLTKNKEPKGAPVFKARNSPEQSILDAVANGYLCTTDETGQRLLRSPDGTHLILLRTRTEGQ